MEMKIGTGIKFIITLQSPNVYIYFCTLNTYSKEQLPPLKR